MIEATTVVVVQVLVAATILTSLHQATSKVEAPPVKPRAAATARTTLRIKDKTLQNKEVTTKTTQPMEIKRKTKMDK